MLRVGDKVTVEGWIGIWEVKSIIDNSVAISVWDPTSGFTVVVKPEWITKVCDEPMQCECGAKKPKGDAEHFKFCPWS